MKTIKHYFSLIILFFAFTANAQESVAIKTEFREDLPLEIVYDKKTDKKIPIDELIYMIKDIKEPIYFENIRDEWGNVYKRYFDPKNYSFSEKQKKGLEIEKGKVFKKGMKFPNFKGNSYKGNVVDLSSYKGKEVLVVFLSLPDLAIVKTKEAQIAPLLDVKKATEDKGYENVIVIFRNYKEELLANKLFEEVDMTIVHNGHKLGMKYEVLNFPSFIHIDKKGKFVKRHSDITKL